MESQPAVKKTPPVSNEDRGGGFLWARGEFTRVEYKNRNRCFYTLHKFRDSEDGRFHSLTLVIGAVSNGTYSSHLKLLAEAFLCWQRVSTRATDASCASYCTQGKKRAHRQHESLGLLYFSGKAVSILLV